MTPCEIHRVGPQQSLVLIDLIVGKGEASGPAVPGEPGPEDSAER